MRILITGCSGLIGAHLAEHLLACGHQVHGTYRRSAENLQPLAGRICLSACDMSDAAAVAAAVAQIRPECIFHLAAQSLPRQSWRCPEDTFRVNALGTLHLLEAVRHKCKDALLLVFGSSAEYGQSFDRPLDETSPLQPDSPYGTSKVAAEMLADIYGRAYGMRVIRVRPFFIVGPGRGRNVFADFAQRIVAAENSTNNSIEVGQQSTVRDILDARDAVRGIALIAERGAPGDIYNVCSGTSISISAALAIMAKLARKPLRRLYERSSTRPLDAPALVGDNSRLRGLGWKPEITLEQTLADVLDYWRAEFAAHGASAREAICRPA